MTPGLNWGGPEAPLSTPWSWWSPLWEWEARGGTWASSGWQEAHGGQEAVPPRSSSQGQVRAKILALLRHFSIALALTLPLAFIFVLALERLHYVLGWLQS